MEHNVEMHDQKIDIPNPDQLEMSFEDREVKETNHKMKHIESLFHTLADELDNEKCDVMFIGNSEFGVHLGCHGDVANLTNAVVAALRDKGHVGTIIDNAYNFYLTTRIDELEKEVFIDGEIAGKNLIENLRSHNEQANGNIDTEAK